MRRSLLQAGHIDGIRALTAFLHFEGNAVVLADLVDEAAHVHEDILVGFFIGDETESFLFVEEFYFASGHNRVFGNAQR